MRITLIPRYCIIIAIVVVISVFYSCRKIQPVQVLPAVTHISLPERFNIDKIVALSDSVIIAAGGTKNEYGAIFRTTDGGESWVKSYSNQHYSINDIYFCSPTCGFACGDSLLILKTSDGGLTWSEYGLPNFPFEEYIVPYNNLYVFDSTRIFAAGGENYYKGLSSFSRPGHSSWYHQWFDNEMRDVVFISEEVGYFAGYGVVLKTEDGGYTYNYLDLNNEYFYDLEYFDARLWVLGRYGKLLYSDDDGSSWNQMLDFGESSLRDLYFSETDAYICGESGSLFVSRDKGLTWLSVDVFGSENLNSICMTPSGEVWIASDNGNCYVLYRRRQV